MGKMRLREICLALTVFSPTIVGHAANATVIQDFDTAGTNFDSQILTGPAFQTFPQASGPAPTTMSGGPTGDFFRLHDFQTNSFTTMGFDRDGPGDFSHVAGSFDFRVTCTGARTGFGCADGFQMALLDTSIFGNSGQVETAAEGEIALDEFGNVRDYDSPLASIVDLRAGLSLGFAYFTRVPGTVFVSDGDAAAGSASSGLDLATGIFRTPGGFLTAMFEVDFLSDLLSLSITDGNTTAIVYDNFDISSLGLDPFNSRLAFGARTGDASAAVDLDNINVSFRSANGQDIPVPGTLFLLSICLAGLGLAWRRRPIA